MALTDAKLRTLKSKEKPYKISDFQGLFVLVNPNGSRLWRCKYRWRGKEKLLSFGRYPEVGLQDARRMRDDARANHAQGLDPAQLKQDQKRAAIKSNGHTFSIVAADHIEKKVKEGLAEITLRKMRWMLEMANADFGQMPISEISAPIVLGTLRKREKLGHYETARRMRSVIGGVFRYGIATGVCDNDPTFALKGALIRPTVTHRAAVTNKGELGVLMRAIRAYSGQVTTRIGLELLALFATRPGELRKSRWSEFDLENLVWSIPADRMKSRMPHMVPISSQALKLLHELRELTGWSDLLFPSQRLPKNSISENTLNQALRRMGFSARQVTSHGFRATFSTLANESGLWHPDAVERAIAHVEKNNVRRAYDRGQHWEERVKMAEWWGNLLCAY
jgi:integrase